MVDAKTVDIAGILSDATLRPSKEIPVVFNEKLSLAVSSADKALKTIELTGDEKAIAKASKEFDKILKEFKANLYRITLQTPPEGVLENIREELNETYPDKTNLLGQPEPNPKADRAYLLAMWQAHIVQLTAPDGSTHAVNHDDVTKLYQGVGASVKEVINRGIADLSLETKAGFELAVKEIDFLSKP